MGEVRKRVTILNLIGQQIICDKIETQFLELEDAMDLRKNIWNKLSEDEKLAWVQDDKDPIMSVAWLIYKYLGDNFFGGEGYE